MRSDAVPSVKQINVSWQKDQMQVNVNRAEDTLTTEAEQIGNNIVLNTEGSTVIIEKPVVDPKVVSKNKGTTIQENNRDRDGDWHSVSPIKVRRQLEQNQHDNDSIVVSPSWYLILAEAEEEKPEEMREKANTVEV